jgi:DNA-binding CsgD family transcriptional regulator
VVFVGRDDEFHLLQTLVGQVRSGRGGAVLVTGEPGIGKTTLIAEALDGAEHKGCRVHSAVAHELSPIFPLHVLIEALDVGAHGGFITDKKSDPVAIAANRAEIVALLYGDRTELVTPRDTVATVADRLIDLVHRLCAVSPTILVIDDVQWADDASLGVLLKLTRALGQVPLLLVIALRPLPRRAAVGALRDALAAADALVIDLGPVRDREAAEMVRQLMGVPPGPALAEQLGAAGGNPLYLRELIDALVRESRLNLADSEVELLVRPTDLPATLPAAIGDRLRFLSEGTLSALRVATVLGQSFSLADLGIVTGQQAADLIEVVREAVTAGVLTESEPSALEFRHVLVHQTLYEGMPTSLRAALHRQAAEALARAGGPVERVAAQLLLARPTLDAWMIDWVANAAPTLSHRAPQVAVDLLRHAREGLNWPDPRRQRIDVDLAMAQLMLGDNEEVVQLGRPVVQYTHDPTIAGQITWVLGYALPRLGRLQEAIDVTDQTLHIQGLPPEWLARVRARRAMSLFAIGRYDDARAEAERAETDGELAGDRLAVGYALYTLAELELHHRRRVALAKEAIDRALVVLRDEPQAIDLLVLLMVNLAGGLAGLGRPAEADQMFGQVAVLAQRATPPRQAHVKVLNAVYAVYRGRWNEALAESEAAAELPLDAVYRRYLDGVMAQVAVHRDDRRAADVHLSGAEDVELTQGEVRILAEFLVVAWALAAERDGNPAQALNRLLSKFDPQGDREFSRLGVVSTLWLPDVVRLAITVGEPAIAEAAAKVCAREASAQARPAPNAAAQHCQGLLSADASAVRAAAAMLRDGGYPLFSAQALENAAVIHAEKGDPEAARSAYLEAIDVYSELDAAWNIIRADARMRQHNIRRGARGSRRRQALGWDALTTTEQKVARLVAAGRSNPDIANQMFLSRHTVESHVSHILTKLNARSRVEIARAADQDTSDR